jgi:hypothetical protein
VQDEKRPPSSWHSNVEPVSLETNEKLAAVADVGLLGEAVIVVLGADASTVQVNVAGLVSVFPAASLARTLNVWEPSATLVYVVALVQVEKPPPSSSHSKVEPASLDTNEKVGELSLLGSLGEAVMVVFGAAVSTVHVRVAGLASVLPAPSVARTEKV